MKKMINKKWIMLVLILMVAIVIILIFKSVGIINVIHSFTYIYGVIIGFTIEIIGRVISIKFPKRQKIFDVLALVILIFAGVFSLVDSMFIIKVPRVTESTYQQAINELNDCGLGYEVDKKENTDELLVTDQEPEANKLVFKNTKIVLKTKYFDSYADGLTEEDMLLLNARIQLEAGNYEEAYELYSDAKLSDNETAQINIIHMSAHGWLKESEDVQTLLEKLSGYNSDYAKLHQLAILIPYTWFYATDKNMYNSTINELMEHLYEQENETYMNYIAHVKYDTEYGKLSNKQKKTLKNVSLEDCYELEMSSTEKYKNPPADTTFSIYKFVGADYGNNNEICSLPYYYYQEGRVKNLEYLDIVE